MRNTTIIYVLLFLNYSYCQTTSIPDPIFEQRLIDLGYDSGPINGEVLTNNINSISSLDISWMGISTIKGIEDFIALKELICSMNTIDTLDFSFNPNLKKLICSANHALYIDVTQNPLLDWLECGGNDFENIDLSQNIVLTRLYSGSGNLTSLDVTNNPLLIYLHVGFNELKSIDITNNPALISFVCSSNQLTTLDFSQSYWLQYTQCQNNLITELNFKNCGPLEHVQRYGNQLTKLDFSYNKNLKTLRCQNNNLKCLNIKNGYPYELNLLIATGNQTLNCIEVNDVIWAKNNLTHTDSIAAFSQNCYDDCLTAGIEDFKIENRYVSRIIDLNGQITVDKPNTILIYIYNDGTTEKVFRIE